MDADKPSSFALMEDHFSTEQATEGARNAAAAATAPEREVSDADPMQEALRQMSQMGLSLPSGGKKDRKMRRMMANPKRMRRQMQTARKNPVSQRLLQQLGARNGDVTTGVSATSAAGARASLGEGANAPLAIRTKKVPQAGAEVPKRNRKRYRKWKKQQQRRQRVAPHNGSVAETPAEAAGHGHGSVSPTAAAAKGTSTASHTAESIM